MSPTTAQTVAGWLAEADFVVAFTGAGISTESGIPDFRSPGGVWAKYQPVYFDAFMASADARHEYWRQKAEAHRDFADALPNAGHQSLANWEAAGRLAAVITQNIDGLHQLAGSRRVLELHGTAREVSCLDCHARYEAGEMVARFVAERAVPTCPACGGPRMKHATVSFGQALPPSLLQEAFALSKRAKLFLAIGSSLVVEPAASLPRTAKQWGAKLVIVNRDSTPQDDLADLVVREPIGVTLAAIDAELATRRSRAEGMRELPHWLEAAKLQLGQDARNGGENEMTDDEVGLAEVRFSCAVVNANLWCDPGNYVLEFQAEFTAEPYVDEPSEKTAGRLVLLQVLRIEAANRGHSMAEVCHDYDGVLLRELHAALFVQEATDDDDDDLKPELPNYNWNDMLVIQEASLLPGFNGTSLLVDAIETAIVAFGSDALIVADADQLPLIDDEWKTLRFEKAPGSSFVYRFPN